MKFGAVSVLILFSFATIAIFGFMAMEHGDHGHMGCIAATAQGGGCPQSKEFDFTIFHLEAYKSFSSSVLADNFSSSLFAVALFLMAMIYFHLSEILTFYSLRNSYFRLGALLVRDTSEEAYSMWLALHEQSPNFI